MTSAVLNLSFFTLKHVCPRKSKTAESIGCRCPNPEGFFSLLPFLPLLTRHCGGEMIQIKLPLAGRV